MPWTAILPAAADIIGGGLGLWGNRSAAGASRDASRDSLAYAREKDALDRADRLRREELEKEQWDAVQMILHARNKVRQQAFGKYGYDFDFDPEGMPYAPGALGDLMGAIGKAEPSLMPAQGQTAEAQGATGATGAVGGETPMYNPVPQPRKFALGNLRNWSGSRGRV